MLYSAPMRTRLFLASLSPVFALGITATAHAVSFAPVNPAVDHILGNPAPKVMIVEYIDLEDETSKQHHATVKALSERYKNKVNWVIRHLPSAEHQNAQKEAEAAECINELGDTRTMWTFIQEVFDATASGGRGLPLSKLTTLAGELDLSKLEFEKCLSSGRYASFVKGQAEQARQGGITAAPVTFLVLGSNGKWQMIAGAGALSEYTDVINAMLYEAWTPSAVAVPLPVPATPPPAVSVPGAEPDGPLPPVDPKTDHIRGKANAPVTVIEYTDFECPFCIRHQKTMSQLLRKYRGSVNWVTRPFPLPFHAGAEAKAVAAECVASLKGNNAFWRFHDQIFKRSGADGQSLFPVEKLASLAKNVGLSQQRFDECVRNGEQAKRVQALIESGTAAGVQGTPANFVLNNRTGGYETISGAVPLSTLTAVIDPILSGMVKPAPPASAPAQPSTYYPPAPVVAKPAPKVDRSWDHVRGEPNAQLSLVTYSDADDPFTRTLYPELQTLLKEYPKTLNLVYRHYPLSFHKNADTMAVAMECAAEMKGHTAFWQFADALYGSARTDYVAIAAELDLNQSDFATCMWRDTRRAHIKQDIDGGTKAGITGTPSSFLIDTLNQTQVQINGAVPLDDFRKAIDAMLAPAAQ